MSNRDEMKRAESEFKDAMLFEGTCSFVRAAYRFAVKKAEEEGLTGEDLEAASTMYMGMAVRQMWDDVVSRGLGYSEYRRGVERDLRGLVRKAREEKKEREDALAEESGYKIVR